ncbi:MAG: polyprenol phosphomannose-dependent alpha 1,6 mannosyltransferase MptB [Actinomycetota bacterium]|nr:polyprenol phosphomannose-dependent alpha 1,6 mannosyltransferase MptB [Actinomycetota bacterium]
MTGRDSTRRGWAAATALSVTTLVLVGALGDSAAVPGLGPRTPNPPWDLAANPPSGLVTILVAGAYVTGGAAVLIGLRMVARGNLPSPRALGLAALLAVTALTLVPPAGSADHLSYLAYGRIAAAGDDPYTVPPIDWRSGADPVAGAVQPPWQRTPSVYGPVATAAQSAVALAGGGSLRLTTWWWQLTCAVAFGAVALLLDRAARPDPARRTRAAVLWTLNPLLLGQLVLGAHLDILAAACGTGALLLVARPGPRPGKPLVAAFPAGLLLGAAVGCKPPYALFGLAACWGLRHLPWRHLALTLLAGAAGVLTLLVPAYCWAGPHAFDQLGHASRFTSLATPWRAVANLGDLLIAPGAVNVVASPAALALAAALAVLLWRRRVSGLSAPDGVLAALVLTASWVLVAPYALPWYDAMVWAPLALAAPSALDRLLLARLVVLAVAYVPGRVVGLGPSVEAVTLGVRTFVAPVLVLAVIVGAVRWALRSEYRG